MKRVFCQDLPRYQSKSAETTGSIKSPIARETLYFGSSSDFDRVSVIYSTILFALMQVIAF